MNTQNYAIAEIAGDQVILEPGRDVAVPKLDLEIGAKYVAAKILFLRTGETVAIGTPYLADTSIETTVKAHQRSDKVIVFKKKRRKGYKVKKGHRQEYTVLSVAQFGTAPEPPAPQTHEAEPQPVAEATPATPPKSRTRTKTATAKTKAPAKESKE